MNIGRNNTKITQNLSENREESKCPNVFYKATITPQSKRDKDITRKKL